MTIDTIKESECDVKFVDLHAHLYFDEFETKRGEIIENMRNDGFVALNIGVDIESSKKSIELAKKHIDIFRAVIGQHPLYDYDESKIIDMFIEFENMLIADKNRDVPVIAGIGECGLDFKDKNHKKGDVYRKQKAIFVKQIELAIKYNKPLMLHIRDAYEETLEILHGFFHGDLLKYKGNAHFFVGDESKAKAFIDMGFSVSFTGVITFVKDYSQIVKNTDINHMFLETDSPYVAPIPDRGLQNNPIKVKYIYEKVSSIKDLDMDFIKQNIYKRAKRYWLLP